MLLFALVMTLSASAQFEKDKFYVGASLTGLDLSYNGKNNLNLGLSAKLGYLVEDNWMVLAEAGFQHTGDKEVPDQVYASLGGRYYIIQNGLFLGANAKLIHASHDYNDVMPGVEVGYAFFLSRTVTIEPSIYYQQSFKNHSEYSTFGLKIGLGIYL